MSNSNTLSRLKKNLKKIQNKLTGDFCNDRRYGRLLKEESLLIGSIQIIENK